MYRNRSAVGILMYKRTLAILLALFLIAGALLFVSQGTSGSVVIKNQGLERSASAIKETLIEKDRDGDGLQDWEETLWGTSPTLADTDADGAIDGEEVRDGRNPLVPGPDDSLEAFPAGGTSGDTENNTTDQVAQQFIGQYLTLKQQGVAITPAHQDALVDSLLESSAQQSNQILISVQDVSTDTVDDYTYANTLANVLNRHTPPHVEHELVILSRALEFGDEAELEKLTPIIDGYENIIRDATELSIPADAREAHVAFLNAALGVKEVIVAMRATFSDPIFALAQVSDYETEVTELSDAMNNLKLYFLEKETRFKPDDEGVIFVQ